MPSTSAVRRLVALLCLVAVAGSSVTATSSATASTTSDQVRVTRNVPVTGTEANFDVFEPRTAGNRPALLMVHGGGWTGGSKALLESQALAAAERGFVVFNLDYTLSAPRYPRQVDEVVAALAAIRAGAAAYRIDPDRIGGLGTSAGGHLLAVAVYDRGAPLASYVGWSGPYDVRPSLDPHQSVVATGAGQALFGCVAILPACGHKLAQASPAIHVHGGPPALLFNSETELIPAATQRLMARALREQAIAVEEVLLAGTDHAVDYSDRALVPTLDFFAASLELKAAR